MDGGSIPPISTTGLCHALLDSLIGMSNCCLLSTAFVAPTVDVTTVTPTAKEPSMRSHLLLASAAVSASVLMLLVGCAPSEEDKAASAPPAVTAEDDAAATGSEDNESADDGLTAMALPENWPAEVPVIDGTVVDAFFVPGDDSTTFWGARVLPDVPLEQADAEALSIMEAAGFEVAGGSENDDGTVNRQFENGAYTVVINISLEPDEEGVLYNVRPR
jgi:hypothetical protein